MNKTKQNELEKYFEASEKSLKEGTMGHITEINDITNTKFFGESGLYDERDGWAITVQIDDDIIEFTQWIGKPKTTGLYQSNLYAFRKKYGIAPEIGMKVECSIDENGFFRIDF